MRSISKANNAQTSSKSPSILSNVATPFTSRKRNLSEFYIESHEPYKQYSPGDTVKGSVNVKVDKAVNLTHLIVCLHGFAKVFSNAKGPGKTVSRVGALLKSGSGKRGAEYFGNGFVSLFEDEVALCGEGRLNAGRYKFEFQLELPSAGLPSSIDFERGTISYMLSSTITKPTTISPTAQCHYKIKVVESINIAPLPAPKPRTVSLEAVPKKSKPKRPVKDTQTGVPKLSQNDERLPDATALSPSGDPPLSPAPSEISSTSATSGSSVSWQLRSTSSIGRHPNIDKERSNPAAAHGISASIEVLRGGCLPGDTLPVQIFVSHGKAIKSLQGIIITLYRLARIDTHPAIPLGTSREGEKPEYEDYYPKSRTGLGGLSLSSAGSCRSFRQDLNQVFAPLIVDPRSLTASVRSSIKVPEDLFPTINTVPGQMISFKYYVEVVVDLRGKLAGQDRVRSQLGIVNGAAGYGNGDPKVSGVNGSSGLVFPLASGFGCLDTSQIRRERSVVSWPFQLVVGTRDSDRKRGKQGEDFQASEMTQPGPPAAITRGSTGSVDLETNPRHTGELIADQRTSGIQFQVPEHSGDSPQYTDVAQVYTIPPPEPEETVDEKPRLRQAEERLLPGAPPGEHLGSDNTQPSAPEAVDHEDFVYRYRLHQPLHPEPYPSVLATDLPQSSVQRQVGHQYSHGSSPILAGSSDDKRELEMRRLQLAATSPEEDGSGSSGTSPLPQPSAPVASDIEQPNDLDQPYSFDLREPGPPPSQSENNDAGESLPVYRR